MPFDSNSDKTKFQHLKYNIFISWIGHLHFFYLPPGIGKVCEYVALFNEPQPNQPALFTLL
jgi:hypothetical protein